MIRSAFLTAFLAISVALFSLASWGRTEINDPDRLAAQSTMALQSEEVRSLLTTKIVDEVWSRFDAQAEIQKLLPEEAEVFSGPAAFASRAAFASAVDNILKQDFVRNVWEESVRVAHQNTLRALQGRSSALLIEKETISLDLQTVLQTAARQIGLPSGLWQNIPPGLGQITLAETTSAAQVQKVYGFVSVAPPILLIVSALFFVVLLLVNRRNIWQGLLWSGGAFLLAGATVLLSREAFPPFVLGGIDDPLSSAVARVVWEQWSEAIASAGSHLFWIAGGLLLLALLFSPLLRSARSQLLQISKQELQEAQKRLRDIRHK